MSHRRSNGLIAAVVTFLGVQTLLVVGLAVTLIRRRRERTPPAAEAWDVRGAEAALARLTHRLMQAQEEERAHIAAALHDDVCQQLTGLKMRLQSLGLESHADARALHARVDDLCSQFGSLERQILSLSDPLYAKLEMLGLVGAGRAFCQRVCLEHRIALEFKAGELPHSLCGTVRLAMFRVLQEAMDNAVVHASTPRIAVSLLMTGGALHLEVVDTGVGFDTDAVYRNGAVGLIGMRERLRALGGSFVVSSRPGAGTRVQATVPI
jgi:signal transduction histidine kinase